MTLKESYFISSDKVTRIRILGYEPTNTKAVLTIAHGIGEHAGRYEEISKELAKRDIAVYAMDFIGHGHSVSEKKAPMYFGENGWNYLVEDLIAFNRRVKTMNPNVPCFMLGFSMGSFVLRTALAEKPNKIQANGAIFVGTGKISNVVAYLVKKIVAAEAKKNGGFDIVSEKVNELAFGNYNKYFKPNKTQFDWLCKDEEALKDYMNDSDTAKYITPGMFMDLLSGMARSSKISAIKKSKNIPILFVSGQEDPVGGFTKGVRSVAREFERHNSDVCVKFYTNSRHDVLHDEEKAFVMEDIIAWINEYIK